MQETDNEYKLTIIHINDVYELENFSKLATCKEMFSQSNKINKPIVILAGDFLSPSLLSSIDKGNGIVDCMNESGVDFVCLGNHESDINIDFLYQRIKQSKFEWINSNIPDFTLKEDYYNFINGYKIIKVYNNTYTKFKKIALLGMCCDDISTMSNGSFSKFKIENINNKTKSLYDSLIKTENVDLVIPITHQDIELDRDLAKMNEYCPLMPLILGGHDHDEFFENIDGCQILKVGMNANKFGICSILWDKDNITKPEINIKIENASNYGNNNKLDLIIHNHKNILLDLQNCNIYKIPNEITLSSKDVRYKQTTIGTFYSTIIKKELELECVFLNSGFIRGNYDLSGEYLTYADFIKTIPQIFSL
jgi:2',3'-cyclic-nucleotide 2'-phosphodiesterase (5'-nucleotidase family)